MRRGLGAKSPTRRVTPNLNTPIYLPPIFQCNSGSGCARCQTIDSLYSLYVTAYPSDTPSITSDADTLQAQKNVLFQNFMNNRLGFNLQTYQYLQFRDTCQAHSGDTATASTCSPTTIAQLFSSGHTDSTADIRITQDGGYVVVGMTPTVTGLGSRSGFMARYDPAGALQWSKTYTNTGKTEFYKVRATSDNGSVVVGDTYASNANGTVGKLFVVKADAAGNTQWEKSILFTSGSDPYGELGYDIIQTSDGGYAVVGDHNHDINHAGPSYFLVAKLNSSGTVLWAKKIGKGSQDGYGIAESGDTLLVVGREQVTTAYVKRGVFLKVKEADGSILSVATLADTVALDPGTH